MRSSVRCWRCKINWIFIINKLRLCAVTSKKLQYDLNKVKEQMANTAAAPSAPAVQNANSSQQQGSSSGSNSAAPQNGNNQASAQNSGFTLEGNLKTADAQAKAAYDNAYKFVTANNLAAAEKGIFSLSSKLS